MRTSPSAAVAAATTSAIRHEVAVARAPKVAAARPRPTGQAVSTAAIAVAISRPANQSAVILIRRMFMRTAPPPLRSRPAAAPTKPSLHAVRSPPTTMAARPQTTARRSPKRWPINPPGSDSATPGSR